MGNVKLSFAARVLVDMLKDPSMEAVDMLHE